MMAGTISNIILSTLSFILAVISIVTVIITIQQNKRLLEANEQQIAEMRKEHQLSVQPIIILENAQFYIERPKFYYVPPTDTYEFLSRYHYQISLRNVSSATAMCIDVAAKLIIRKGEEEFSLDAVTERENILPNNKKTEMLSFLFAGDKECHLYEALRANSAVKLPKLEVQAVYQNTCGGFFLCKQTFILAPEDSDFTIIRTWHTALASAPIEAKEALEIMKTSPKGEQWRKVFKASQEVFDLQLGESDKSKVIIGLIEIPEKYSFQILTQEEYAKITKDYWYPHFIHHTPTCKIEKECEL